MKTLISINKILISVLIALTFPFWVIPALIISVFILLAMEIYDFLWGNR